MQFTFGLPIPLVPIAILIVILMLFTEYSWNQLQHSNTVGHPHYMIQLVVDISGLSLLIYLTGGSTNPFIFFFLLPITFAAASLNFKQTCIIACLAAACYTLLMFYHVPLLQHSEHSDGFDLHVWGMWYGFLISAALLTYFVSRIRATVLKRNQALAVAREENLRADQVLALGTLAAGTAHELGTPLSTMAVLTKELEYDYQHEPDTLKNLQLLREQINRCKTILSRMATNAGTSQAEKGKPVLIHDYFSELLQEWKTLRPETELVTQLSGTAPDIQIIVDVTVKQSIINVLNNAADAADSQVIFNADWDSELLQIEIMDDGEGIDPEIKNNIGWPGISDKQPEGIGIGLFLAQITLNRLGGHLQINNQSVKGAQVSIQLPLSQFKTA